MTEKKVAHPLLAVINKQIEEPPQRRPVFLAHPAMLENAECLVVLHGMKANGIDVLVMSKVNGRVVHMDEWANAK